jgi:hypothetical protein
LQFSKQNEKDIFTGQGWSTYFKDNDLKEDDTLMFVLQNPPSSINVSVVDRC